MRITLADIIRRGHRMADVPEPDTTRSQAFCTVQDATDIVNDGLSELHDLLMERYEDYLTTRDTVSMVAGERETMLPSDFLKLRGPPYLLDGSNQRVELIEWKPQEIGGYTTTETAEYPMYRILNTRIFWHPLPAAARTIELWYVRQFRILEDKADEVSPEIPRGWHTYPAAVLAEFLLRKMDKDPSPAMAAKLQARQRVISAASNRNAGGPQVTRDVHGRYGPKRRFPIPRA